MYSERWQMYSPRQMYSEPCQTSKKELFAKTVNSWMPLNIFTKSSILDVWQGSEYASVAQVQRSTGSIGVWPTICLVVFGR